MADLKILMVLDGARFNFGPAQATGTFDAFYFGISELVSALTSSTTPTIAVDRAHRRGATFAGQQPDTSVNLTFPGDFDFTSIDLTSYDVLWLIGDEGVNGGVAGLKDKRLSDAEKAAIAKFMNGGGGVFAVGDHDGIGAYMCGRLPRIRTMRKWFASNEVETDPGTGQKFMPNWSAAGDGTAPGYPGSTDRFDTLLPDSGDSQFYFYGQSDPTPQLLLDKNGIGLGASILPIHPILRGANGDTITRFPDHMHEGEATDFAAVSVNATPFNPNDGAGNPNTLTFTDKNGQAYAFPEFPKSGGFQPTPQVIVYGADSGHATKLNAAVYNATNPKMRGLVSVYDGRGVGVGRVLTGSTFHHYLDKNLIGDPKTQSTVPGTGPTGTDLGLPADVLAGINDYYVNVVTWLARPNPNFYFWTIKNTFSFDELQNAAPSGFGNAFYLAVDGFTPNQVGNPNIGFSGPLKAGGAVFNQGGRLCDESQLDTPQRILLPVTVQSIAQGAFPVVPNSTTELALEARIAFGGVSFAAEALFELVAGADPYFQNVDPASANIFYLSQDLRIFQVTPILGNVPLVAFPSGGADAPNVYLSSLLGYLNNPLNPYTVPPSQGGSDPFQVLSEPGDLSGDSSVDPTKRLGSFINVPNYNFAIARVRLRGNAGLKATNVKVFFRLFATQSNDTDFDPALTYRSTLDAANLPDTPLPGANQLNFPFFASAGGSGDYNPGINERDISAPSGGGETWAYFGCYLNVYNNSAITLIGTHHCLVAEIAYDGTPIKNANGLTLSPENSDKLAQRNLQITSSGNPGGAAVHRIPQTFDLRASARSNAPAGSLMGYPDELVIEWGNVPVGSKASIFWPQASARDVIRLATLLYAKDEWVALDSHTVQCKVRGRVSYVPIPYGASVNLASLLTIDLPIGVRAGQQFKVVVRRVSTRQPPILYLARRGRAAAAVQGAKGPPPNRDWRYIVGTFQVTIPVATEESLLWPEENTLAIMKWRLGRTAPGNRWHPVLKRYVDYIAARVDGFGGNSGSIQPSPTGVPAGTSGTDETIELTGKVCEVCFDCFGDFEGFVLESCSHSYRLRSRERGIGELVLRACRERLVLSVCVDREHQHRVRRLVVRC